MSEEQRRRAAQELEKGSRGLSIWLWIMVAIIVLALGLSCMSTLGPH